MIGYAALRTAHGHADARRGVLEMADARAVGEQFVHAQAGALPRLAGVGAAVVASVDRERMADKMGAVVLRGIDEAVRAELADGVAQGGFQLHRGLAPVRLGQS